jgi:TetR/AcrR family transcriptional repressor of nem operon
MRKLLDELVALVGEPDCDADVQRDQILLDLAMLVGALSLARATAGDPISDLILDAVRGHLSSEEAS